MASWALFGTIAAGVLEVLVEKFAARIDVGDHVAVATDLANQNPNFLVARDAMGDGVRGFIGFNRCGEVRVGGRFRPLLRGRGRRVSERATSCEISRSRLK